jgi:uncharacterized protein YndB with AHSA1/START domain
MPTSVITNDIVACEIEIAAPPERVFEALTDEKQLSRWFTNPECPVKESLPLFNPEGNRGR